VVAHKKICGNGKSPGRRIPGIFGCWNITKYIGTSVHGCNVEADHVGAKRKSLFTL